MVDFDMLDVNTIGPTIGGVVDGELRCLQVGNVPQEFDLICAIVRALSRLGESDFAVNQHVYFDEASLGDVGS